jgi:hypothetical protein
MIDCNFTLVENLPADHFFKNIYQEATAFLRTWKDKYVIDWDKTRGRNHFPEDPIHSKIEYPAQESFPVTDTFYCDKGDASVTYYKQARPGKDGVKNYSERNVKFIGKEVLSVNKDLDKIFYLLIASTHRPDIPELAKWQNASKALMPIYNLENRELVAKDIVRIEEIVTTAKSKMFGDTAISESVLRLVAGTLGIPHSDTITLAEVKQHLNAMLFAKDSTGAYKLQLINEFIQLTKLESKATKGTIELGALIQKAVDKKVIRKEAANKSTNKVTGWYFLDKEGKAIDFICGVPVGKKQIDVLIEYLDKNPEVLAHLEASMAE